MTEMNERGQVLQLHIPHFDDAFLQDLTLSALDLTLSALTLSAP